jgi:hypothetical protein
MAYIQELEDHLHIAQDKCKILENELCDSSQKLDEQYAQNTTLRAMLSHTHSIGDPSTFFLE